MRRGGGRRRKHAEHVNHERWLVSYADFITLLFAFFTTLYAISTVDQKKAGKLVSSMRDAFNVEGTPTGAGNGMLPGVGGAPLEGGVPPVVPADGEVVPTHDGSAAGRSYDQVKDELLALAKSLGGAVEVRVEKRGVVVSLTEATLFASGKADILPTAITPLAEVANQLAGAQVEVLVEGHTDNVPVRSRRYASNWELSTARATSVVAFALEYGVLATQLAAAGYGEHWPRASNTTAEGRAKNRRVDLVVRPASEQRTAALAPEPQEVARATPGDRHE